MPKVSYAGEGNVEVESFERRVSFPVNQKLVQSLNVGDEVEVTIKAKVTEVSEEKMPPMPGEGEEEKESETVRRLGLEMDEVEVYPRGENEFEDMARDEEY